MPCFSAHKTTDVTIVGDALVLPPLFPISLTKNEKTQHDQRAAFLGECKLLFKWMP